MLLGSELKVQSRSIMGYCCSALWVNCEWRHMMYRKTGGVRLGEGVVVFQALLFVSTVTGGGGCCGEEAFSAERDMLFSQPV